MLVLLVSFLYAIISLAQDVTVLSKQDMGARRKLMEYDYPYKWVACCDADHTKDSGDPMTNFVIPVTTSGKSYRLFQGSWPANSRYLQSFHWNLSLGLASLNDVASATKVFRYVEPFALLTEAKPVVVPLKRMLKVHDTLRLSFFTNTLHASCLIFTPYSLMHWRLSLSSSLSTTGVDRWVLRTILPLTCSSPSNQISFISSFSLLKKRTTWYALQLPVDVCYMLTLMPHASTCASLARCGSQRLYACEWWRKDTGGVRFKSSTTPMENIALISSSLCSPMFWTRTGRRRPGSILSLL